MLVLTRKSNQSIMIGDDIEVSVLSIMGEKVRIGIQAPRDIPVFRKEVFVTHRVCDRPRQERVRRERPDQHDRHSRQRIRLLRMIAVGVRLLERLRGLRWTTL